MRLHAPPHRSAPPIGCRACMRAMLKGAAAASDYTSAVPNNLAAQSMHMLFRLRRRTAVTRASAPLFLTAALLATLIGTVPAAAQTTADLTRISVEDLMRLEVTSVSKKERPLATSPAAVFVLTQDDIRRSGLT